jgi:hypothetical protein
MNTKLKTKRHFISTSRLQKNLFSYLAIGLFVLALSLSVATILPIYSRLKAAEDKNIEHAVDIMAVAVGEWARHAKALAWQITSRTRIREELEKYNNGEISLEQVKSFTEPKLIDAMNLSKDILGIIRIDTKGQLVAKCGLSIPKEKWPLPDTTLKNITASYPSIISNYSVLIVGAPILNRDGGYEGSDLVVMDLFGLKTIILNYSGLGKTNEIITGFLLGNQVRPVFPSKNQNMEAENKQILSQTVAAFLKKGINGNSGLEHMDKKVFAYTAIADFSWGLLISQTEDELYADLNRKLIITGLLSFLIYLVFLFGFWLTMNPLSGRLLLYAEELEDKIREKTKFLNEEIVIRKKTEEKLKKTVEDLQKTLDEVKTLSGLLPICAKCKKIRDDKGYWNQIEGYIQKHSDAQFSHSMCSECSDELYSKEDWYIEMKNEEKQKK